MKTVLFITGSYPPDICGVGDYTSKLLNSGIAKRNHWRVFYKRNWNLAKIFKYVNEINRYNTTHIVLQYPTQGYGWSLLPHLLCVYYRLFTSKKFISVLHEFSNASPKNRLAEMIFVLFSDKVVCTNEFEKDNILRSTRKNIKVETISICSNIVGCKDIKGYKDRQYDLIYFGHIRPNKGIEVYLKLLLDNSKYFANKKVAIIGQVPVGFEEYYDRLKKQLNGVCVDFILNREEYEISIILNNAKFAYLPFPDGISERRGSFLACIFNGVNVITTSGKYTTESIRDCVFIPQTESELLNYMSQMSDLKYNDIQKKISEYIRFAIPSNWDGVAKLYMEIL